MNNYDEDSKLYEDDVDYEEDMGAIDDVAPKKIGKLDMVLAFDTTGSMASYIGDVRIEVADLIPRLFKDNEDLHLGTVTTATCLTQRNSEMHTSASCRPTMRMTSSDSS